MFGFSKKKNKLELVAPLSGNVIPVTEVPDPVFSDKILGDGVGIEPTDGQVYAPTDGTIFQIAHTFHAFGMQTDQGLEILVHLGIDTVKLEGKGFTCKVEVGQKVHKGDLLMVMDLDYLKSQGLSAISPCVLTNMEVVSNFTSVSGPATGGQTTIITCELK